VRGGFRENGVRPALWCSLGRPEQPCWTNIQITLTAIYDDPAHDAESHAKQKHATLQFVASAYIHCRVAFLPFARLVLNTLKPKKLDFEPPTFGGHISRRRLELELTQPEVADRLGVNLTTVLNWERERTTPLIRLLPALFAFLGYSPLPEPSTVSERLLHLRRELGWSIREAARQLGVDPTTWRDWERGELILFRKHRKAVAALLRLDEQEVDEEMRARWGGKHPR
jgi:transcriptional regulator with XRE-family HTH domain